VDLSTVLHNELHWQIFNTYLQNVNSQRPRFYFKTKLTSFNISLFIIKCFIITVVMTNFQLAWQHIRINRI